MPSSVDAYHENLLQRYWISTLAQAVTPVACLLAVVHEPLTTEQLGEMLTIRFLVPKDKASKYAEAALRYLSAVVQRVPDTARTQDAYLLFHESFRRYISESQRTQDAVVAAASFMSWLCGKLPVDTKSAFKGYIYRHGVQHLIIDGSYAKAVRLLDHFYKKRSIRDKTGNTMLRGLVKTLADSLIKCSKEQANVIDGRRLLDLLVKLDEFELLYRGMDILYRHHTKSWSILMEEYADYDWTVKFAISLILANSYLESNDARVISLLHDYPVKSLDDLELTLYVAKLIYLRKIDLIDSELLGFGVQASLLTQGVVGELLLDLALMQNNVLSIFKNEKFWNPVWPYHRAQVDDILAAGHFFNTHPLEVEEITTEIQLSIKGMERAEQLRQYLLSTKEIRESVILTSLLNQYWYLPATLGDINTATTIFGSTTAENLKLLFELLLLHPSWEVGEAAASMFSTVAETRTELIEWNNQYIRDSDWHVRYAAMDFAYFARDKDQGKSFMEATHFGVRDQHSWVRGLAACCLVSLIKELYEDNDPIDWKDFVDDIHVILNDNDFWQLQEMHDLLRYLLNRGVDINFLIQRGISPFVTGEPHWLELNVDELYRRMASLQNHDR